MLLLFHWERSLLKVEHFQTSQYCVCVCVRAEVALKPCWVSYLCVLQKSAVIMW